MFKSIYSLAFAILISVSIFANNPVNPVDKSEIETVIKDYVTSTDNKDVDELQKLFYDKAAFVCINKISDKVVECDKDTYLEKVKTGKLGGWTRNFVVENVDINDETAVAKVVITDKRLKQVEFISLAKMDGHWQIVSRTYTLEVNK